MKFELVSIHFPGSPGYENANKAIEKNPVQAYSFSHPYDYLWCLNIKRRGEFALRKWIEQQPNPHEALRLLDNIMLIQDYVFETTSISEGFAIKEQNERIDKVQKSLYMAIRKLGMETDDLW